MITTKLTFNRQYFYLTILRFLVEMMIAVFVDDQFIRPLVGDVLSS
ncbi:MAG: hypothetical protein ACK5EU_18310 [Pseudanabaena sp.]|jgi:hypothetical protein|nr:hypothetical protein [Pseudanabaena mucicola]MCA6571725.1 hypothetical protein [Pseudanabaena sp. M53BS1SP1A06MG]MCA6581806.1 hypothetical protein [Pseudanabaena sp. M34BS1SP1A06MG]MCA6585697.1 hypothetical protein [Pseudanabaena sp. M051S1SP1A06QC]MCA6589041.1 hypothetical protein [Pseudanabaena sp. M109S1SP1A06QC]MCA6591942.1 hypothetical protein [Pseudanabaena sp. M38BS1SP1A06MG]MCA6598459.1 hypothetical protein [Pseudanabaena sp. M046S1SP1A06QC]MCA6599009.1 hypothetical protein [Pseud